MDPIATLRTHTHAPRPRPIHTYNTPSGHWCVYETNMHPISGRSTTPKDPSTANTGPSQLIQLEGMELM